jgi:hypothetical protein
MRLSLALHWSVLFAPGGRAEHGVQTRRLRSGPSSASARAPSATRPAITATMPVGPSSVRAPALHRRAQRALPSSWSNPGTERARLRPAPIFEPARRARPAAVTAAAATRAPERRGSLHWSAPTAPLHHPASPAHAERAAHAASPDIPPRIALVWRKAPLANQAAPASEALALSPRALAAPATAAAAVPAGTAAQVRTTTRAPAQTLDAGLAERLADDVIRRVERHVRIERERRGLL